MRVLLLPVLLLASILACDRSASDPTVEGTASTRDLIAQGIADQKAGRLDEAAAAYRLVIAREPTNKFAYFNLGLIAQTRGDLTQAETLYEQALEVDENFTPAMFNLAIIVTKSQPFRAIKLYRRLLEIDRSNAEAFLNLGYVLEDQGKLNAARKAIRRAIELEPSLRERISKELLRR